VKAEAARIEFSQRGRRRRQPSPRILGSCAFAVLCSEITFGVKLAIFNGGGYDRVGEEPTRTDAALGRTPRQLRPTCSMAPQLPLGEHGHFVSPYACVNLSSRWPAISRLRGETLPRRFSGFRPMYW